MVIVTMKAQTLPLTRMKAGNSGKKIWGINKAHNKGTESLSKIKSELLSLDHEEDIIIPKKDLRKMLQSFITGRSLEKMDYRDIG